MRIERIEIFHVRMPLIEPFRTAFGTQEANESVFVRMFSEGISGWGESAPGVGPYYSGEWGAGAFAAVRDVLAPRLVGQKVASGAALQAALGAVKGNFFAKAALDLAWWDLWGRAQGMPVWKLIGGTRPTVETGEDIGVLSSIPELIDRVAHAAALGMRRIKLKAVPGWDINMLEAVRARFPDITAHIDCNAVYALKDLETLRAFDRFKLAMIEQPMAHDDIIDHAHLQSRLHTPICLDESITSLAKARKAVEAGACRWVNIKTGRVGGLTNAVAIHDFCASRDIPCWVGFMIESALGQAQSIALATLPNMRYPGDIFPSARFYAQDICEPAIAYAAPSEIAAPMEPGFGRAPDERRLRAHTLARATVGSDRATAA
jgi:O-succinylbenzoate synthase